MAVDLFCSSQGGQTQSIKRNVPSQLNKGEHSVARGENLHHMLRNIHTSFQSLVNSHLDLMKIGEKLVECLVAGSSFIFNFCLEHSDEKRFNLSTLINMYFILW